MSSLEVLSAFVAVTLGAALQGSVGFGLGMLASPLLVVIDPRFVPAPLLVAALALTLLVARRERGAIDFRGLGWALAGRIPGTALGALAVAAVPESQIALVVAVVVFVAVAIVGSGFHVERSRGALFGAGTLSGLMATTTSIGGPPMAILYQHDAGDRIRGTLSGFFVVGLVLSLIALALVGRFGVEEIRRAFVLMPGVIAGFLISSRLAPALDKGHTRAAVLAVSVLAGLFALVRALLPWP